MFSLLASSAVDLGFEPRSGAVMFSLLASSTVYLGFEPRSGHVMCSLLASSVVDLGVAFRSGEPKDYNICIGCFSNNPLVLNGKRRLVDSESV
jgi:hypothetical protein